MSVLLSSTPYRIPNWHPARSKNVLALYRELLAFFGTKNEIFARKG
jgi:hypothetical protein